jgi:hypothetical protein
MVDTRAACCRWPWTILNYYGSLFERRKAAMLFFAVDLSHRVCDLII